MKIINPFKKDNLKQLSTRSALITLFSTILDGVATGFSGTTATAIVGSLWAIFFDENANK